MKQKISLPLFALLIVAQLFGGGGGVGAQDLEPGRLLRDSSVSCGIWFIANPFMLVSVNLGVELEYPHQDWVIAGYEDLYAFTIVNSYHNPSVRIGAFDDIGFRVSLETKTFVVINTYETGWSEPGIVLAYTGVIHQSNGFFDEGRWYWVEKDSRFVDASCFIPATRFIRIQGNLEIGTGEFPCYGRSCPEE